MSQTPHDSSARYVTRRWLETLRRDDLYVSHLVHRQSDVLVAEFRQNDTTLVNRGIADETSCEVDHRYDRAAEIEQTTHVWRRAGKSRCTPKRNDLSHRRDVAAVDRTRHGE